MSFNIPRDNNNKIVRISKTINVVPSLSQAISIGSTGNTNFASVNTLSLNNVVVTATGTQLNFVDVTPGIASPSKALVLNSSSNITGINNISCNELIVNGTNITSSLFASASSDDANNQFMTTVVPGIAQPSKALILNSNNNIKNINKLSTQSLNINNTEITVNTNNSKNLNINNLNNSSANNFLYPNGYFLKKNSFNSTDDNYIKTTNWSSVCWSPTLSLYVAVCTGSVGGINIVDTRRVITSTTGNTWSVQTIPIDRDLKFVCWSPKLSIFVAVGNVIIISSNGINWTTSMATVPNTLTGICWSEELSMFVAVSEASTTNKVLTSVDGIIWTMRYTPGDCQLKSICWSPELNLFVAGGGSSSTFNNIMASSDGINWSLCNTLINGSTIISICWSPEKMLFLAVSSNNNSYVVSSSIFSNDGYNWTMFKDTYSIIGGTKFTCVCWAKDINMFLSIEDESNSCYLNYSTNGYFWKRSNAIIYYNKYNQIIWNSDNKQFIAVASNINNTSPHPKIVISSPLMISSQINLASNSISFSKTDSKIGINTTSPNKLLEINSVNGNCFKHIFNLDTTKFVTYDVLSNGQFNVTTQKFFQIPSDNSTYGLMLNNTLIKTKPTLFSTYLNNNTLGTATKSKMLITDSNNNISGINALYCNSVIENGVTLSTSSNNQYFQNAITGTSVASSVLITDINNDISGINEISMNNLYINNSKLILPGNDIDITLLNNKVNEYRSSLNNAFTRNQIVTINNITGINDMIWIKELNIFVGISSGTNRIIYSKDGINWINVKDTRIIDNNITSIMNLNCICWSPELSTIIIFGRFTNNKPGFLLSKDGIDWEISDNLSDSDLDIVSICWSPELKIFAGIGSSGTNRVVISNNGINWIPVRISTYNWNTICWCNTLKIFVASCNNSDLSGKNIIYSYDGINWITVTLPYDYGIVSIAWSPSLNMIIAIPVMKTDSPKKYYPFIYSYDIINWSLNHTLYEFAGLFTKINWLNNINMFIATSITTVSIVYSFNGYNWYQTNPPNTDTIKKFIWSEELQVILAFYESNSINKILLLDLINTSENTAIKSQSNEFVCDNVNFRVGLGVSTPTFQLQLSSDSAAKPSSSTWNVSSDERLKDNIVDADIDMCYNNIKNLKLKRYTWKDEVYTTDQVSDRSKLGWIAQEVETVFPKAVEKHNMHGYEDCRTLNSDQIIASMYGCAKQIIKNYNNTEIFDKLNDNIKKLESFINSLPEE